MAPEGVSGGGWLGSWTARRLDSSTAKQLVNSTARQLASWPAGKQASSLFLINTMHYKNLKVWQRADELALEAYKITRTFPKDELYGLTSQLRRASLSVATNIVEGYARKGDRELARFVNIAIGSIAEVEYLLDFSKKLGYLGEEDYQRINNLREHVSKLLWNFYRRLAV